MMCRIFGYLDRAIDPGWLDEAGVMLRHGGPDATYRSAGLSAGRGWGLGATRLAITDPAGGAQPYELAVDGRGHGDARGADAGRADAGGADAGGGIRVVFNGEIYNHDELRADLLRCGYRFGDRCDGSILPALYHRYGMRFVDRLDGMYAIAVLDLRGQPSLALITDGSGMKPLYYSAGGASGASGVGAAGRSAGVCFASELPALLALPDVDRAPWTGGLDAYLTTKTPFGDQTMFRGIRVLPPATTAYYSTRTGLVIHERGARGEPGGLAGGQGGRRRGRRYQTLWSAGGAVREALRTETGRLAKADVPVAAICSGGLDSSLVTGLLAERVPALHAFHIGYRGDWPGDEYRFARCVAERAGVLLRRVRLDPARVPELLPDVVEHLGQPNADPITVSTLALFRAVHDAGFKVALTGDAADEHFGGYDRFKVAAAGGPNWLAEYLHSLAACPRTLRERLYSADYRDHLRRVGSAEERLLSTMSGGDPLERVSAVEIGLRLPAYHLRRVDHLSMASAVEVRLPFCQPAVVDLAGALPAALRVTPAHGKRALYAAAAGLVPREVAIRPKQPFTLPILAMMRPGTPLLTKLRETLSVDEVRASGQLDPVAVRSLVRRHEESPTETTALALWSLGVFQLWYRHFVTDRRPAPTSLAGSAVG